MAIIKLTGKQKATAKTICMWKQYIFGANKIVHLHFSAFIYACVCDVASATFIRLAYAFIPRLLLRLSSLPWHFVYLLPGIACRLNFWFFVILQLLCYCLLKIIFFLVLTFWTILCFLIIYNQTLLEMKFLALVACRLPWNSDSWYITLEVPSGILGILLFCWFIVFDNFKL